MSTLLPTPAAVVALAADELAALIELVRHSRDHRLTRGLCPLRDVLGAHREPDWIRSRSSFAAWTTAFHPPTPEGFPADEDDDPVDVAPPALEVAGCMIAATVEQSASGAPTLVLSVSVDGADQWITSPGGTQVPVELRLNNKPVWSRQNAHDGDRS